jgi:hypothetical protein
MRRTPLLLAAACAFTAGTAAVALGATAHARPPARRSTVAAPRALPPHTRFPAPWVGLVGAEDRAGGYDPTRLRTMGDTADVWLRYQFPRDLPLLGDARPPVRALELRYRVRCADRRARDTGDLIALGARGDTVGTHAGAVAGEWKGFSDADFNGGVLTRVCACLRYARGGR